MASTAQQPFESKRLEQIANDACNSALGNSEFYEHSKTGDWNTSIINSILKSLISESSPSGGGSPSYKYAVNSTIIQHLVPTSSLNKAKPVQDSTTTQDGEDKTGTTSTDGKPHVGRRGMHSATGAYWNDKTDGMWSFKYGGGENKGLDVVISVIWISI